MGNCLEDILITCFLLSIMLVVLCVTLFLLINFHQLLYISLFLLNQKIFYLNFNKIELLGCYRSALGLGVGGGGGVCKSPKLGPG